MKSLKFTVGPIVVILMMRCATWGAPFKIEDVSKVQVGTKTEVERAKEAEEHLKRSQEDAKKQVKPSQKNALTSSRPDALAGAGLAYEIERRINSIADFTHTTCIPGAGNRPDAYSFIILSEKPVFGTEPSKKLWLLVVAAAVGKTLHENPTMKADEVFVSDVPLMKKSRGFVLDASLLPPLQQRVYSGEITPDQMYAEITRALKEKTIP